MCIDLGGALCMHFPAIAVLSETADSGIVRATRENGFSRMIWNGTERRGGFCMESVVEARMKTANPSEQSSIAPSSVVFDTRSSLAFDLISGAFSRRGCALMERGWMMNMKIMIFSINMCKFTGFFDKFLKNNVHVNDCNKKGYHINLSVLHSDMAAQKVFWFPRICPQLPALPPAPHYAHKPSFINRL